MVTIHRKSPNITGIKGHIFLPGMNQLSDAEFDEIKNTAAYKSEIACGNMVQGAYHETANSDAVEADNAKARAAKIAQELRSISDLEKAKELISKIVDPFVLKALASEDGRKGINDAIQARINSIKGQEGADLTPESKVAPEGSNSDFADKIGTDKDSLEGTKVSTAIPAAKGAKK